MLKVRGSTVSDLHSKALALNDLAQELDDVMTDAHQAGSAVKFSFQSIRALDLSLPHIAEHELDETIAEESALLGLLPAIYAIQPRTPAKAMDRAKLLISALNGINSHLASLTPPRPEISAAGKTVADLVELVAAHPGIEQAQARADAAAALARAALASAAKAVDRLNKKFYASLLALIPSNPVLADVIKLIKTSSPNRPRTLGIKSITQGGGDGLHLVVVFAHKTFNKELTNSIEWFVAGEQPEFSNKSGAEAGGNSIGPFPVGKTVRLRTRATSGTGSTLGRPRNVTIHQP